MMRKSKSAAKRHKRIWIFLFLFALICLIVFAAFLLWNRNGVDKNEPLPTDTQAVETTAQTIVTEKTLIGVVRETVMNTLTVETADASYVFSIADLISDTEENKVNIGDTVCITYTGILDTTLSVQTAEVTSVVVKQTAEQKVQEQIETRAKEQLSQMSLEEKVGQMFLARCPSQNAVRAVTTYHLGGYILFGRDFANKTEAQVISDIQSYQDASNIPLFIGVDEEGGTVNRVSSNPNLRASPFLSPQALYATGGMERIRSDTQEKNELLHKLGINLNFAPVCDVSQNPNDFIYDRSFGKDAEQTAEYVSTVVGEMKRQQMGSVLKHFPGYGNNADTHTGVAYDNRPYDTFLSSDFLPFQAGIEQGADMVLVSHNIVNCMDPSLPASLSAKVHEILRKDLDFQGVIITDDLAMQGVRAFADDSRVAVQAVLAGNDLLCCTDFETQIPAVIAAVENGEITQERIDASVLRILILKISLGLL